MATDVNEGVQAAAQPAHDERLVHQGPIQRLLVRPEIGALIGVLGVWAFFWAVSESFATADGTVNYLHVAAPLGIMAVAVSLLMIGGEFDLSAGAMTGAAGILLGLLANEAGNNGLSMFIAVPIVFAAAAAIGWFNGNMVNRTGLPSFIVTLGTFFVLQGATLGFTKQITDKVLVDDLDEAAGYEFFRKFFASSASVDEFALRDDLFVIGVILGGALAALGLLELTYRRRDKFVPRGLIIGLVSAAAALVGFIGLLQTDTTAASWVFGILIGGGIIGAFLGLADWRYVTDSQPTTLAVKGVRDQAVLAGGAIVAIVAGIVAGALLDSDSNDGVFLLLTEQALRAILFVGLASFGLVSLMIAAYRAGLSTRAGRLLFMSLTAVATVVLAFAIRNQSESKKFTVELFTFLLLVAVITIAVSLVEFGHPKRRFADDNADRMGTVVAVGGILLIVAGVVIRTFFTTTTFRVSLLWWVVATIVATYVLFRARFGNWIFAVGGNRDAARSVGVPASRTKTTLFMVVSMSGAFVGMMTAFRLKSVQANQGVGEEFEYIIAAVVGGNLLTGGYGTATGAALGATIMAMAQIGIPFARWNTNWRFLFIGAILLLAVLINNYIRKKAQEMRGGME